VRRRRGSFSDYMGLVFLRGPKEHAHAKTAGLGSNAPKENWGGTRRTLVMTACTFFPPQHFCVKAGARANSLGSATKTSKRPCAF